MGLALDDCHHLEQTMSKGRTAEKCTGSQRERGDDLIIGASPLLGRCHLVCIGRKENIFVGHLDDVLHFCKVRKVEALELFADDKQFIEQANVMFNSQFRSKRKTSRMTS